MASVVLGAAGCGSAASHAGGPPAVYAASSLRGVLRAVDPAPRYAFGGSGLLARQIGQGAPADVFASADAAHALALHRSGRCGPPVAFATNRLVVLVPAAAAGRVRTLADLRRPGLRLALGAAGVPAGAYARAALRRLGLLAALGRDAVSAEPDVAGVVAKVALRSADAGFAYHTDALATAGRTREIALPAATQPTVRYLACAVRRPGADASGARAFLARLRSTKGQAALRRFGFGIPAR